jgi:CheY-like chemotaxis protein
VDQPDIDVAPGDYVVLSVTDTGTGMPPDALERVMEPFFSTKGPGAGSGLGLSMIYGFAKQSGGHLRIESELGKGTVVRLYFPRAAGAEMERLQDAAAVPLALGDEAILVVDDNLAMRTVARRHLVALGYRVSEAESGPAALAILKDNTGFDLLFTDIVMPDGMTGYQLAAIAQQRQPGLKVLFTTGYAKAAAGEPNLPHASVTLRKPYRKQELAATVRAALEA